MLGVVYGTYLYSEKIDITPCTLINRIYLAKNMCELLKAGLHSQFTDQTSR